VGHARHGPGDHRARTACRREDRGGGARGRVPRAHRDGAVGAHAGRDDRGGIGAAVPESADRQAHGRPFRASHREARLPGQLLSHESPPREGCVRGAARTIRRQRAGHDGRTAHAARRGPEDGQPRPHPWLQEPAQHLRRHSRAPHLEPPRLGRDENARRDRAGALRAGARAVVALHQPLPRDVGPERVPADAPPLRRLRGGRPLPAHGRDADRKIPRAARSTPNWCIIRAAPGRARPHRPRTNSEALHRGERTCADCRAPASC